MVLGRMIYGRGWPNLALAAVVLIGATQARASVIISTLGPAGNIYDSGNSYPISGTSSTFTQYLASAMGFTPSSSTVVTQIDVTIALFSGTAPITLSLNSNAAGIPGAIIDAWVLPGLVSTSACPATCLNLVTITTSHALTGGTQYWLVADTTPSGDAAAGWWFNTQGFNTPVAMNIAGTGFVGEGSLPAAGFALYTDTALITPEPSTIALGGAGLLLVAALRRRRRSTPAA